MINNFKLGIKMFRYGSGLVGMIVCSCIFLVLGLLINFAYYVLGVEGGPGDVFLVIIGMYPIQILYSLSASNFIASSPAKKRMQTSVPAAISCFNMLVIYLINSLVKIIVLVKHPENIGAACGGMVFSAGFIIIIMLYLAVAYKYFWVSILMGIAVYFFTTASLEGMNAFSFWPGIFGNSVGSFVLVLVLGLAFIVMGGFGQYGMSLLVYKAPMSKYAQSAAVRKEM